MANCGFCHEYIAIWRQLCAEKTRTGQICLSFCTTKKSSTNHVVPLPMGVIKLQHGGSVVPTKIANSFQSCKQQQQPHLFPSFLPLAIIIPEAVANLHCCRWVYLHWNLFLIMFLGVFAFADITARKEQEGIWHAAKGNRSETSPGYCKEVSQYGVHTVPGDLKFAPKPFLSVATVANLKCCQCVSLYLNLTQTLSLNPNHRGGQTH